MSRKGKPYDIAGKMDDPRLLEKIDSNFDAIFKQLGVTLPALPTAFPRYLAALGANLPADFAKVDPDGIDVTGTPSATTVLYGDRWDALPTPSGAVDYRTGHALILVSRANVVYALGALIPSNLGTLADSPEADSTYSSFTTAAGAGSSAGWWAGSLVCALRHGPTLTAIVRTGADVSSIRLWIGLTSDTRMQDADDQGGTREVAAFRYSTVVPDAGWVGITRDGATQAATAAILAVAANTRYRLDIRMVDGDGAYFSVNQGAEVKLATNLPASATMLYCSAVLYNQVAVARVWKHSRTVVTYGT